jgi:LPXTG-site transpeptidase (sortase) family protein
MAETSLARRTTSWLLTGAAIALVAGGVVAWRDQEPVPAGASQQGAPAGEGASVAQAALPSPRRLEREPGSPRRLRVPDLGIDAPVVPVGTRRDTLIPPTDPQQVGWWGEGVEPGASSGRALLAGHTVSSGGGALDDLEDLGRGARVVVVGDEGRVAYEVEAVRTLGKGRLAQQSERLFRQDGPAKLVLLTCEDWDGEQYLSNVVVVARPAR